MDKKIKRYLDLVNDARETREKIKEAETEKEIRSLGDTLQTILKELQEAEKALNDTEDDKDKGKDDKDKDDNKEPQNPDTPIEEGRNRNINVDTNRRFDPMGTYSMNTYQGRTSSKNILDSMEYRQAFAKYVQTGEWNLEQRADEILTTQEIGKIIPNTIMQEFIKELKVYGQLFNKVRKMNVRGGVEIPIQDLVPQVKWITETTVSDTQKAPEIKTSVSFGYHIAEARIAQTLLSSIVGLDYLEKEIARLLAEAFIKEFDNMIVNGSGNGAPLGILNDTRVLAKNKITFNDAQMADWINWRKSLFSKIPLAYTPQGTLIMTLGTWESQIMTLRDDNNRPLYQQTYDPQTGNETRRFNGKEVIAVEPDIIKDFDTATTDEPFAIYLKPTDYAINSNLQVGFKRYYDDDNNKWINKGLTICDGKLLDVNGVFILKKGATA